MQMLTKYQLSVLRGDFVASQSVHRSVLWATSLNHDFRLIKLIVTTTMEQEYTVAISGRCKRQNISAELQVARSDITF